MALALALPVAARAADGPPAFPREFRAAWVATVANIDWPSRPGISTDEQQREAMRILDLAVRLNLNAVVFQVRPSADALYESRLEPWSAFLTGEQGKRPDPVYDPLAFWVEEAHRRGLQLHAWFNPFRARAQGVRYAESADHISKTRPDLTRSYGGMLWLDPGEADARDHTARVILDIVRRYDIDGIHVDDYFYPYPVPDPAAADRTSELDFPDEPSWRKFRDTGGGLERAEWRRQNINALIRRLYEETKREKPWVLFGISPFGIPRPGQPAGVVGFDQYEKLYADTLHWLKQGWCDYLSPQLYWKIDAPGQPFRPLLSQWIRENTRGRHIWPGLSVSRVGAGGSKGFDANEILGQIAIIRETPGAGGEILFSMKALVSDRGGIARKLTEDGPYREPALVPDSPWLGGPAPGKPVITAKSPGDRLEISIQPGPGCPAFLWAVSTRRGLVWSHSVHPAGSRSLVADARGAGRAEAVAVAAVSRFGLASEPALVPLPAIEQK